MHLLISRAVQVYTQQQQLSGDNQVRSEESEGRHQHVVHN